MRSDSSTQINKEAAGGVGVNDAPTTQLASAFLNMSRKSMNINNSNNNNNSSNNHSGMKPLKVGIPRIGIERVNNKTKEKFPSSLFYYFLSKTFLCKQVVQIRTGC